MQLRISSGCGTSSSSSTTESRSSGERLARLRGTPDYQRAFDEAAPLVSVVIPTDDRGDLLMERAIPSILTQTYPNFEIIVVGDCAPAATGERLATLADPRITYHNLTYRGPYPEEPRDLWHVAGIPPRNLGVRLARGLWIAPLDDDDASPIPATSRACSTSPGASATRCPTGCCAAS